jgi:hypothetical protein
MKHKPLKLPKVNFLGFGMVYVLIYLPQFWMVKIGYSGVSVGNRAKSVSKAVFGVAIPVAFMVVPFAWHIEQFFHSLFGGLNLRFYKGQGQNECFIFPGHIAILIVWFGLYLDYAFVKMIFSMYF